VIDPPDWLSGIKKRNKEEKANKGEKEISLHTLLYLDPPSWINNQEITEINSKSSQDAT